MKRLLSIIGAISLIGTSTTSLVACNKTHEYTKEELKELKEKNKINTANKEIKDNLEWIAPQEKPFNTVDNKYYYVVWKGNKDSNWRLIKFQNNNATKELDNQNDFVLRLSQLGGWRGIDLAIFWKNSLRDRWIFMDNNYFKSVYRWNSDKPVPDLIIDDIGNVKIKGE